MKKKQVCNMNCLNCIYPDCINNSVNNFEYQREWRKTHPEYLKRELERKKQKYRELKSKGICTMCRKRPATHGTKCYDCTIWTRKYNRDYYWKHHKPQIVKDPTECKFCRDKALPGRKVCAVHLEALRERGRMSAARRKMA